MKEIKEAHLMIGKENRFSEGDDVLTFIMDEDPCVQIHLDNGSYYFYDYNHLTFKYGSRYNIEKIPIIEALNLLIDKFGYGYFERIK